MTRVAEKRPPAAYNLAAFDTNVGVWTGRGPKLTQRLPELADRAAVGEFPVVLDTELLAGQGQAGEFYGVLPKNRDTASTCPVRVRRRDVLAYHDGSLIDCADRRVGIIGVKVLVAGDACAGGFAAVTYGACLDGGRSSMMPGPLTVVAFDVLAYDHEPVIGLPYERRRALGR